MNEGRGSWYLVTGVILGIFLGIIFSWMITPAEYTDTFPDSLRVDFKDAYRAAIASAFSVTNDLKRAKARLGLLNEDDSASILAAQSQRYLAEGYAYDDALVLARLAAALGEVPAPAPRTPTASISSFTETPPEETPTPEDEIIPSETVESPTETITPEESEDIQPSATPSFTPTAVFTRTPILTFTPLPTRTPTPTLAPPYILQSQALVCEPTFGDSIAQIVVINAAGEAVPGVEIIINWADGEEHFFTGLKPEMGWGYADYVMTPEVLYSLHAADGGEPVDLFVPECSDAQGERYWGGWYLVFTHP